MTIATQSLRVLTFDTPPAVMSYDLPAPAPSQIRIRVHACGLNFADLLMCKGTYQDTPTPPFTLGLEMAGVIDAVGTDVIGFRVGDRIAAFAGQGGLATYANIEAARCIPLPDSITFDDAAALQIAYGTSHMALTYKAQLKKGERLVVTGAAGGVGLTAVEVGKLLGAEVIAIARGADKLAIAKDKGADHLIDADSPDIRAQIKALGGADVVYDAVGGDLFEACFRATNPDGRILLIGFAGGDLPTLKPNHMLVKNISVIGFYWGAYFGFNPAPLKASLAQLFDWAARGEIAPHISHRLPLDQATHGLALLKERKATGKVIIAP
ncbi:NADPH:quinone oxidoreductase family protein [Celeribacter marinus]|uniref:Oxidoreductase, zinc-binding dehydrogenase family n=1 Tax=Celeribacter marinus TaxID=1397108 RepID=A0A0N9ZDQ0_9RHOB|nr:NADPH:quinone oxidoreductase family protein [Celeribacter marinus]ALI54922.1 oxidoreductase, zinc-binding dehydrogenase family [Celeribacter marinus]SFK01947.1 NADPH2:quinone reductase [Celeribacter marinus]